jgi:hypothetical protein
MEHVNAVWYVLTAFLRARDRLRALVGKHFHGFLYSFLPRLWPLRLGDPLQVFSPVRRRVVRKKFIQPALLQGIQKIFRNPGHDNSIKPLVKPRGKRSFTATSCRRSQPAITLSTVDDNTLGVYADLPHAP